MAKTPVAAFAQTPKIANCVVTGANTDIDDAPTNSVLLLTAGAEGAIVTRITAVPRATVTATALYIYTSNDSGTTQRLKDSALMSAYTLATTTAIPVTEFTRYSEQTPMRLAANERLYVAAGVALAGGIVFSAEYTDF